MAKNDGEIVIKKYANRRLYNTGTSTYVTLDDLAGMVKRVEDFVVQDAKSGEDITHSVLTQIIFEQESKTGNTLLPISFLRQLISIMVTRCRWSCRVSSSIPCNPSPSSRRRCRSRFPRLSERRRSPESSASHQMIEEQVRRNTEIFQNAMKMLSPFSRRAQAEAVKPPRRPRLPISKS